MAEAPTSRVAVCDFRRRHSLSGAAASRAAGHHPSRSARHLRHARRRVFCAPRSAFARFDLAAGRSRLHRAGEPDPPPDPGRGAVPPRRRQRVGRERGERHRAQAAGADLFSRPGGALLPASTASLVDEEWFAGPRLRAPARGFASDDDLCRVELTSGSTGVAESDVDERRELSSPAGVAIRRGRAWACAAACSFCCGSSGGLGFRVAARVAVDRRHRRLRRLGARGAADGGRLSCRRHRRLDPAGARPGPRTEARADSVPVGEGAAVRRRAGRRARC